MLLLPLTDASQENNNEYWKWLEEMVLAPTKNRILIYTLDN